MTAAAIEAKRPVRLDAHGLEGDEAARVRLAARASTPPALLHRLAHDQSATVRAAVAMNPAIAPDADLHLLDDADERVRILLAGKLATLLPGVTRAGQDAALDHVSRMLAALANDVAARVRIAMAHALTSMPEAPKAVVLRLARDPMHGVSDPVLRLCPLLTDHDLLELLATPAHDRVPHSVAARPGLSAAVADHIAAHAHHDAVRVLLHNQSASIREATLDMLVGRAGDRPEWHEPLLRRPTLPAGSLRTLLALVSDGLRGLLAAHGNLPAELAQALQEQALGGHALGGHGAKRAEAVPDAATEEALAAAIETGDATGAGAVLAAAAGVPVGRVEHAVSLRSGKGVTSLVWKAGFSPVTARALLAMLGLPPGPPAPDRGFPLSVSEMEWQIELLDRPGDGPDPLPGQLPGRVATTPASPLSTV